jgi:hypothetical protein
VDNLLAAGSIVAKFMAVAVFVWPPFTVRLIHKVVIDVAARTAYALSAVLIAISVLLLLVFR